MGLRRPDHDHPHPAALGPEAAGLLRIYVEARAASWRADDDIERTALRVIAREAAVELADYLAAELAERSPAPTAAEEAR